MSAILRSQVPILSPSPIGAISPSEAAVGRLNPHLWLSARDRVDGARSHKWRDRVRQSVWASQGGVFPFLLSGRPVMRFNSGSTAFLLADYQLPPSYGIFVLANVNGFTGSAGGARLLASESTSGNRMWLQVSTAGTFTLAHGSVECNAPGTVSLGAFFAGWAGYDIADKAAGIGRNTASVQTTQTFAVDHKGQSQSVIGGYSGSGNLNGYIEELIVFDRPMNKSAHAADRATIMGYLADRAGIALS